MSYKKQELLTPGEYLSSTPVFGGSDLLIFVVLCVVCCMCLDFTLSSGVGVVHFIIFYVFYVLSLNNVCQDEMTHTCLHHQFVDQV